MAKRGTFFDEERREKYKVLAVVKVDYLPGDIYAYTDTGGWHNVFVKEEFYGRTRSIETAKRWINQVRRWLQTDFYDLKGEAGKKEWEDGQAGIAALYLVATQKAEDLEAELSRAREAILDLKHDHPFHLTLNPKEN